VTFLTPLTTRGSLYLICQGQNILFIKTQVLPYVVDKSISLSTRNPKSHPVNSKYTDSKSTSSPLVLSDCLLPSKIKTRPIYDCRCDERLKPKHDEYMSRIHWVGRGTGIPKVGMLVDKDDLINYQLLIIYQLLIRTFTYQPTVDKTIVAINQLLTLEGLLMIIDKVWKLTNTVRVGLDARSSHAQTQSTFPDTVCSHCPPCHGV
jgi:hypothetical protein